MNCPGAMLLRHRGHWGCSRGSKGCHGRLQGRVTLTWTYTPRRNQTPSNNTTAISSSKHRHATTCYAAADDDPYAALVEAVR